MAKESKCGVCDVRDSILNSVGKLIKRYGYKKMTMDDIAHEAGIGKGTIYLYFPSKEEVSLSWIDNIHQNLSDELKAIADSEIDTQSKLTKMLISRVMLRFEQAQDMAESLDELCSSIRSTLLSRRDQYQKEEAAIFADVLESGRQRGELDFDDIERTAVALLVSTNSLLPYSLSTQQIGDQKEILLKVECITNILLKGLLSR